MTLKSIPLFFLTLLLVACDNEPEVQKATIYAFATEIGVSLYGVDQQTADRSISVLQDSFSHSNELWHAWQPSTLSHINTAITSGKTVTVSNDVAEVITLAKTLAMQSHHLFNPAAGKLFELWGFQRDNWFESHPPPAQSDIDAWLHNAPSMSDIEIHNKQLTSHNTKAKLGFGGFAKGFAVDQAIIQLKKMGIANAVVNIGGDLRAIGSHGKRPWNIGIRHPRQDGVIASIAIEGDESVFTSGDYERFFTYQGKRYPHIIDPRTGYPASNATSVTVLHNNASIADAAATALFVAGSQWPEIAASMDVKHVMLITPEGHIELSPDMEKRIHIVDPQAPIIIRNVENPQS